MVGLNRKRSDMRHKVIAVVTVLEQGQMERKGKKTWSTRLSSGLPLERSAIHQGGGQPLAVIDEMVGVHHCKRRKLGKCGKNIHLVLLRAVS